MILNKKISMGVGFANKKSYEYEGKKYEADLKDGDIVEILSEGVEAVGSSAYGSRTQLQFKIKTRNGEKAQAFNQTSQNLLIDAFGEDTKEWVGKQVKVWIDKVMGEDGYKYHVFIGSLDTQRDEETGKFSLEGTGDVNSSEDIDLP